MLGFVIGYFLGAATCIGVWLALDLALPGSH